MQRSQSDFIADLLQSPQQGIIATVVQINSLKTELADYKRIDVLRGIDSDNKFEPITMTSNGVASDHQVAHPKSTAPVVDVIDLLAAQIEADVDVKNRKANKASKTERKRVYGPHLMSGTMGQ